MFDHTAPPSTTYSVMETCSEILNSGYVVCRYCMPTIYTIRISTFFVFHSLNATRYVCNGYVGKVLTWNTRSIHIMLAQLMASFLFFTSTHAEKCKESDFNNNSNSSFSLLFSPFAHIIKNIFPFLIQPKNTSFSVVHCMCVTLITIKTDSILYSYRAAVILILAWEFFSKDFNNSISVVWNL